MQTIETGQTDDTTEVAQRPAIKPRSSISRDKTLHASSAVVASVLSLEPLITIAAKTTFTTLRPQGSMSVHLRSEGEQLCCALLELGICQYTFSLASPSLLDAAEGQDDNGNEEYAGNGAEDGNLARVGECSPPLGSALRAGDAVVAVETEGTFGPTGKKE